MDGEIVERGGRVRREAFTLIELLVVISIITMLMALLLPVVRKVGLKEPWVLKWHREYDTSGPWTQAGGVVPRDWPGWMKRFKDY